MRASHQITVGLGQRSYAIRIGAALDQVLTAPPETAPSGAFVITDSHVAPHWLEPCRCRLEALGYRVSSAVIPAGEGSKTWAQAGRLLELAVEAGLDRKATVVALGGGVPGDLGGFVAATLLRGVRLIQVPTSLLAMVDSSVGGKTGVNLPQGKNLAGVFYQPREVAICLDALGTLPDREFRSGMAEVIKYGLICDRPFFEQVERLAAGVLTRDDEALEAVVARSCELKAEVVGQDEREAGVRAILNFGHTLGHAIETVAGYGALLHGEAVAIGMVYASLLSERCAGCPAGTTERLIALLQTFSLPVTLDGAAGPARPEWSRLRAVMAGDKKSQNSLPRFVLLEQPGKAVFGCAVPEPELEAVYHTL